jgi:hypothetical protein
MTQAATQSRTEKKELRTTVFECAWPALLVATACLLPFLNKPFVIDDPHFLTMAGQILKSPLRPMNFDICWNVLPYCVKAYDLTPGNVLMGYALVPTVLGGSKEWMAHFTQLVFVWVSVLAMCSFVLRLRWSKGHAMIGALLLVAIPPLLPMASTAMPDVLALAVGLVGIERLAAWKEERKWHQGIVAAIALGLAGIARAHLVLFLPLAGFFLLNSRRPREILRQFQESFRLWMPVLAGGCVLLVIILVTREHSLLVNPPSAWTGVEHIRGNLRSYLLYFAFPLPLAACWVAARWIINPYRIVLMILAIAAVSMLIGPWNRQPAIVLTLIAGYALCNLFWETWKSRNPESVFLCLWLLVPLPIVYYGHLPIKYLLPIMPAIILLSFRMSSTIPARIARTAGILLVIAGIAYSWLILRADAEFAYFGRDALLALVRPQVIAGKKVWFPNQFSAYWYAPLAGAQLVIPGVREPEQGDLVVTGVVEAGTAFLEKFPNRKLVQALTHHYHFGRTMGAGASLYTNSGDIKWLWTFRNGEGGRYELWVMN